MVVGYCHHTVFTEDNNNLVVLHVLHSFAHTLGTDQTMIGVFRIHAKIMCACVVQTTGHV